MSNINITISLDKETAKVLQAFTNAMITAANLKVDQAQTKSEPEKAKAAAWPDPADDFEHAPNVIPEAGQKQTPAPAPEEKQEPEKALSFIDARKRVAELLKTNPDSRAKLTDLLKEYGAEALPGVPQDKLAEFVSRLEG